MNLDPVLAPPVGTTGYKIAPWSPDEIYGVVANWADSAAPVYRWSGAGWQQTGAAVAQYRHEPLAALAHELRQAVLASGEDPDAVDLAAMLQRAVPI